MITGKKLDAPVKAILKEDYQKKPGLVFFLKGFIQDGCVTISPAQASYQVGAFSNANCWVELPAEEIIFYKDQEVFVHLF
jgi:molybdopterin molybdotransferase